MQIPVVESVWPATIFKKVDFPAPLTPTTAIRSWRFTKAVAPAKTSLVRPSGSDQDFPKFSTLTTSSPPR